MSSPEDCNDGEATVYTGAREVPYDGIDQDCDGYDLVDVDEDAYPSDVVGGGDCNDADAATSPAATEICNLRDDDCDGRTDEDCATAVAEPLAPGGIWWVCGPALPPGPAWLLILPFLWCRRASPLRR